MRAVKAKALRKALGFHPGDERVYERGTKGVITCCTKERSQYQKVKHSKVLTTAVLRTNMAGEL